eukprot:Nitzschia sp. Nitz4//scaffold106_size73319//8098//9635//NITZ4_005727-RA/size73319-augustus-gene-0.9-mRNA-1//-1//CDS//3329532493//2348//frame0
MYLSHDRGHPFRNWNNTNVVIADQSVTHNNNSNNKTPIATTDNMAEDGKLSWKESNLALVGSDLDHKIKAAAAEGETAWQSIGNEPGVKVWRVEQFKIVEWPESDYGCFYTGDSYIVMNSFVIEDKLYRDIYIWIGSESSQDEYGTAAYKMVEADDFLGGAPIQHREVQGNESFKFKKIFGDLTYWQGGVESGFNHVEPTEEKPNLFRVKGTAKNMSLTQVDVSKNSLNAGDSFILKASPAKVWLWNGESANPNEKARAAALAEKMCSEGTIVVLEQGSDDDADFWAYLGEGEIGPDDEADVDVAEFAPLLFRLPGGEDADPEQVGKGETVSIGFTEGPKLPKDLLDDGDVFLLDAGWELFLWIGKDADRSEKLGAFAKADMYCQDDARTADLPLTIVKSGTDCADFDAYFA